MKRYIVLLTLVFIFAILFAGCNGMENTKDSGADDSQYSFVNTSWSREAEHDTETIRFGEDGSFSYSCSCGNPVNDSDLCEGYTYDAAAKTITLNCIETTDETITTIKIVKCDENSLHLDFDGKIKIFEKTIAIKKSM